MFLIPSQTGHSQRTDARLNVSTRQQPSPTSGSAISDSQLARASFADANSTAITALLAMLNKALRVTPFGLTIFKVCRL